MVPVLTISYWASLGGAPIVPGHGIDDSAHVLEHALDTPKAPTGEDERFRVGALWCLIEERGRQALIDVSALGDGATEGTRQIKCENSGYRSSRDGPQSFGIPHDVSLHFQTDLKVRATPFMQ